MKTVTAVGIKEARVILPLSPQDRRINNQVRMGELIMQLMILLRN